MHLWLVHMDPRPARSPTKDRIHVMSSGVYMVFRVNSGGLFCRVRREMRADLRVLTLRLTSCVYRFPLHLLGLQSKSTEGLSTGEPRGEQKNPTNSCKEACQHLCTSIIRHCLVLRRFQSSPRFQICLGWWSNVCCLKGKWAKTLQEVLRTAERSIRM